MELRKNLLRLLKAFLLLGGRLGGRAQLVVSGQKGWLTRQLYYAMGKLDLGEDVIFTGYMPQ